MTEVFAEQARRVSVKQNGRFRSLVKPGQRDERFENKKPRLVPLVPLMPNLLESRDDINSQRSFA